MRHEQKLDDRSLYRSQIIGLSAQQLKSNLALERQQLILLRRACKTEEKKGALGKLFGRKTNYSEEFAKVAMREQELQNLLAQRIISSEATITCEDRHRAVIAPIQSSISMIAYEPGKIRRKETPVHPTSLLFVERDAPPTSIPLEPVTVRSERKKGFLVSIKEKIGGWRRGKKEPINPAAIPIIETTARKTATMANRLGNRRGIPYPVVLGAASLLAWVSLVAVLVSDVDYPGRRDSLNKVSSSGKTSSVSKTEEVKPTATPINLGPIIFGSQPSPVTEATVVSNVQVVETPETVESPDLTVVGNRVEGTTSTDEPPRRVLNQPSVAIIPPPAAYIEKNVPVYRIEDQGTIKIEEVGREVKVEVPEKARALTDKLNLHLGVVDNPYGDTYYKSVLGREDLSSMKGLVEGWMWEYYKSIGIISLREPFDKETHEGILRGAMLHDANLNDRLGIPYNYLFDLNPEKRFAPGSDLYYNRELIQPISTEDRNKLFAEAGNYYTRKAA